MSAAHLSFCDLAVAGVQTLQPYQPGLSEAELRRRYGLDDVVKLASNEAPLGPSPRALEAARGALAGVHRYPQGDAHELRQALAARHAVDPSCLTLGNGSNDVLDLVARAFLGPGREAVVSRHAFAVYAIATASAGGELAVVEAQPEDRDQPYGHDLAAMAGRITDRTRVIFVANPNNPTGTWLTMAELETFLRVVPPDVIVVLDEAYADYAQASPGYPDGTHWLARHPNLVVTRTFSKSHGLAGLRVGYAICATAIAEVLNRVRQPFNVNAVAQAAATAALADEAHIARAVALNSEQRARLEDQLAAQHLRCLPSAGNFLCVEVGDRAHAVNETLLRQGVIVRPVAGYELPRFLRISVGTADDNDRLLAALTAAAADLEATL